jgi:hypothetical protein
MSYETGACEGPKVGEGGMGGVPEDGEDDEDTGAVVQDDADADVDEVLGAAVVVVGGGCGR